MVDVHMLFLCSTSFIYMDWPRCSFLHRPMNPLLAHFGWHSPLVGSSRNVRGGLPPVDPSFLSLTRSNYTGREQELG